MSWKPRSDDVFFPAMSLLILAVVVFGFADSYFLPGMVFAKLPNALVHIHGALYVSLRSIYARRPRARRGVPSLRKDGSAVTTRGVETQVYLKESGRWRLVHVHYSEDHQPIPQ